MKTAKERKELGLIESKPSVIQTIKAQKEHAEYKLKHARSPQSKRSNKNLIEFWDNVIYHLDESKTRSVLDEIKEERIKQDEKWGEQNHPILDIVLLDRDPVRMCQQYEIPSESRARQLLNFSEENGELTYMHILMEEVSEVASTGRNTLEQRKELVQVAAVACAMIESIDRNAKLKES